MMTQVVTRKVTVEYEVRMVANGVDIPQLQQVLTQLEEDPASDYQLCADFEAFLWRKVEDESNSGAFGVAVVRMKVGDPDETT